MRIFRASKTVTKTAFSDFIRNASAKDKKRVYERVLRKASERQEAVKASRQEPAEQQ